MEIKRGIPVAPGVAIGPAMMLDTEWFRIPQRTVERERVEGEVQRLHAALADAARQARANQKAISDKLGHQWREGSREPLQATGFQGGAELSPFRGRRCGAADQSTHQKIPEGIVGA